MILSYDEDHAIVNVYYKKQLYQYIGVPLKVWRLLVRLYHSGATGKVWQTLRTYDRIDKEALDERDISL